MKTNTFFTILIAFISFISNAVAQNAQGLEIGFRVQPNIFSIKNGELFFKKQINEHKWHRFSVGDIEASFFPKNNPAKADIDVSLGRERRWFMVNNTRNNTQFALITGSELTLGSRYVDESRVVFSTRNAQNSTAYIGANAVLGMQFDIDIKNG